MGSAEQSPSVAVIGAGVAGLACARSLGRAGVEVRVFEKARGVGGRVSTRRMKGVRFDLGAPYVSAVQPEFGVWLNDGAQAGVVQRWPARVSVVAGGGIGEGGPRTDLLVGVPGMSDVARQLGHGSRVTFGRWVRAVVRAGHHWRLEVDDSDQLGPFERVVVAVPAPQAVPLLAAGPELAERAGQVRMSSTWVASLGYERPVRAAFEVGYVSHPVLALAIHDGNKPSRHCEGLWVLHASHHWSREHLEAEPGWVAQRLHRALEDVLGVDLPRPVHAVAHRWRFASALDPLDVGFLYDPALGLAACGDWCLGNRVEHAFVSGSELATAMLRDRGRG